MENNLNKQPDIVRLLFFIIQHKRILLILTLTAFLISVVIAFAIPKKYESQVIIFPGATQSLSQTLLDENTVGVTEFGEEEDAERLLQVLRSREILEKANHIFSLTEHYEIDPESNLAFTKLRNQFEDDVRFRKTEYYSIEIKVRDKNPIFAAQLANGIAGILDSTLNVIRKDRAMQAYILLEKEFMSEKAYLQQLEDSLKSVQTRGITDFSSQTGAYHAAYAKALSEGDFQFAKQIETKIKVLSDFGGQYLVLSSLIDNETKQLSIMRARYLAAKFDAKNHIPHTFIVERAYPAEKKTTPKRSVIIVLFTFSAFFFILMALLFIEKLKQYNLIKS